MEKIPIRQLGVPQRENISSESFKIRKVEDIVAEHNLVHSLHRHDFFFLLILKKGKGHHEIDFTSYKLLNNSVFFLRPGQVHQLEMKIGCTGFLLEFNAEFYYPDDALAIQRLRRAGNKNYCRPEPSRFNRLLEILSSVFQEYKIRAEGYKDVIRASLTIFFIEFVRQSTNPNNKIKSAVTYTEERFEVFSALLEKHISTCKKVSQYASLMNLSSYQLNEIGTSYTGKSISQLINEYTVLEAKRYLLATSGQVKDIADQLGYGDVSYFIRFFKKHTGYTPEAFRQNLK